MMYKRILYVSVVAIVTAVMCVGYVFGQSKSVTTLKDSRDGKVYKIVEIGNQKWLAENLNYDTAGSVCYDNKAENCTKYGRLYDWNTAMAACPAGTYLPSDAEWDTLINFVGGQGIAGKKLKSTSGWRDFYSGKSVDHRGKTLNGTNDYGFSALPGGFSVDKFNKIGSDSYWWTATKYRGDDAIYVRMESAEENQEHVGGWYWKRNSLYSVRCLQGDVKDRIEGSHLLGAQGGVKEKKDENKSTDLKKDARKPSETKFTDSRDKKVYKIVNIGKQSWFAENLNYNAKGSVCYENSPDSCAKYGRLYNWETALTACPAGTHLPTNKEWDMLVAYVGGWETGGTKLKSSSGWKSKSSIPAGTNDYGFSALPGGGINLSGEFGYVGESGRWWCSKAYSSVMAYYFHMWNDNEHVSMVSNNKEYSFSIRCVVDN
jgi:uncharacterized protein (TIGR02145 family)